MRFSCILTWLLLVLLSAKESISGFTTGEEEILSIVAGPNQTLLVTAGSNLLQLSSSLKEIEVKSFGSKIAAVGIRWSEENPTITVVCLSNQTYFVFNSSHETSLLSNLMKTGTLSGPSLSNAIALHLDDYSFYVGKFGLGDWFNVSYLAQYQYDNSSSGPHRVGKYLTVNGYDRLHKHSFRFGGFIYFVTENRRNEMTNFTITRLCDTNPNSNPGENCFQALYEAQLTGVPNNKTSRLVDVQLINGFESIDVPMVIVSISSNQNSGLYAFKLADIDKKMMDSYKDCKMQHHETDTIDTPWMPEQQNCKDFGVVNSVEPCDFKHYASNVMALYTDSAGTPHLITEIESSITASKLVRQSGKLFLYTAHPNGTSSYITKFLVTVSVSGHGPAKNVQFSTEPVHQFQKSHLVKQLVWSEQNNDTVYYTTINEVHKLPVDECPELYSCSQCVTSANPLCGWCVLEGVCSTLSKCQNGSLDLRWVMDKGNCPDISVISNVVSSDNFNEVTLNVTSGLPELVDGDMYSCLLTNQQHNVSLSFPLKNNTCQIQSAVFPSIQLLNLQVSVTGPLSSEHVVTVVGIVTVVVCSQAKSCTSCLDLSSVCGWCNLDTKCTGGTTLCTHEWLKLENSTSLATQVCPVVLLPAKGVYDLLASKVTQLVLSTSNTPILEGFEHSYQCELDRHGNASLVTVTEATNQGSNSVICHFNESQTGELATATESASLRLILNSNHTKYIMEVLNSENISTVIPVRMYNCSAVAQDCSTCVSTSHTLNLNCGWCTALKTCSPRNETCPSSIAMDTNTCPLPILHSVSPNSGSIFGGTVITISGEDLGVRYTDIVDITIGGQSCTPLNHTYIFGTQIRCRTGTSSESGSMSVVVLVRRGDSVTMSGSVSFLYLEPVVSSVYPLWGPVAGGSRLIIRGTHFDIGNTSGTRVLLGETACNLMSLQADKIDCITTNSTATGEASVKVVIDGAVIQRAGVVFEYRPNPHIIELQPNRTIPAGGITLYFKGQYMDSVNKPKLQLVYSNHIYSSECETTNSTHISCKAPKLSIESDSVMTSSPLDYTLLLDEAPRPDPANITLSLNPNPHFSHIYYSDRTRAYEDPNPIRIEGNHIDSVLPSEIQVKIGEHPCPIVLYSSMVLACLPPNVSQQVTAPVVVDVANNTLTFSVGTVSYLRKHQPVLPTFVTIIIVVAVLVLSIATLILAVVCVKCWTRKHPPLRNLKKHTEFRRKESTFSKSFDRSIDPNNDYCDLMGDNPNIYESIDAVVYQNNPIKQHILASKHLMDTRRPASDNLNLAPTYQNPHIGLHEGPSCSSSSPNIVGLGSSSTHTSQTQISTLADEDDIDGISNTPALAKVEFASIALRRPKKQDPCMKTEDEAENNEDYVQMRSSKTSLHPWDRKSLCEENLKDQSDELEDHYVVMRSTSESSVKSPSEQQQSTAEAFEYPSTNPLYECSQAKPDLSTDEVFYSSCGDYVAMKRIN